MEEQNSSANVNPRQDAPAHAKGTSSMQRLKSFSPFLIAGLIIFLVCAAALRLLQHTSPADIWADITHTKGSAIVAAAGFTLLSFAFVSVYDFSALSYLKLKVPFTVVFRTSFCAYAVGNLAGFGPLTGGAIRFRFYRRLGLTSANVAAIVAFITLTYGLGVAGVVVLGLIIDPSALAQATGIGALPLRALGAAFVVAMALLILISASGRSLRWRNRQLMLPKPWLMLMQLIGMFADLVATAAVLWVLLPPMAISFPAFLPVFAIAVALGIASHVPAGLGAFEAVIIGLVGRDSPIDQIISCLLVYRIIYYGLPLLIATLVLAASEWRNAKAATR